MSNASMKAMRINDYGPADKLVLEQAPCPEPKERDVILQIKAAGVNPADWKYRSGMYKQFAPLSFPWIPGLEAAGIVETVGSGVTAFQPGQAVFGFVPGAYAEYSAVPASDLALKPASLSFDQAASVPVGAMTAWSAVESADIQPGQQVLVHGGAGGVGNYAVQLAHWKGAHVIATASAANADFVRSLGADEVIDYQTTRFETVVTGLDAVIDTVGGDLVERSFQVLRPDGIFVTIAARVTPEQGLAHNVRAKSASRANADKLVELNTLIENGQLKVTLGKVFPLADAAKAHTLSETGHGRGRIVLHIAD